MVIQCQLVEWTSDCDPGVDPLTPAANFQALAAYIECFEIGADPGANRGVRYSHGFSDGAINRCSGAFYADGLNDIAAQVYDLGCVAMHDPIGAVSAGTPEARANITAFGASSFTLNWNIGDSVPRKMRVMLFGGDITNVAIGSLIHENGAYPGGIHAVALGFAPNFAMLSGDQFGRVINKAPWNALGGHGLHTTGGSNNMGFITQTQEASYCVRERDNGNGSADANGFGCCFGASNNQQCPTPNQNFKATCNGTGFELDNSFGNPPNDDIRIVYMAIAGDFSVEVGTVRSPIAPGLIELDTAFVPVAGLVFGGVGTCSPTTPQISNQPKGTFGMFDEVTDSCYWHGSAGTIRSSFDTTPAIVLHYQAIEAGAPFQILETASLIRRSDGIDLNFENADTSDRNLAYIIFGNSGVSALNINLPVISSGALPPISIQQTFEEKEVWPLHDRTFLRSVTGNAHDAVRAVEVDWTHGAHPALKTWLYWDGRPAVGGKITAHAKVSFPKDATGLWTALTNDTGVNAPNLDGLTWTVNVSPQADALLNRGHLTVRLAQSRRFTAWMNGLIFNPQLVRMGSPAWENTSLVPVARDGPDFDAIPWPSFFDHVGDVVDTARIDRWIEEFVGAPPTSKHGFTGIFFEGFHSWEDGGRESGTYGGGDSGVGNFPTDDQDPSYQFFECLEYFAGELYKLGCCMCVRYQGTEGDGNENGLPGGYNGTQALRLQDHYAARLLEIPGVTIDYGVNPSLYNGAPSPPDADFTLVRAVFNPFYTRLAVTKAHYRKIAQTAGEPDAIVMCQNYRGNVAQVATSMFQPISDLTEVNCYQAQGLAWDDALPGPLPVNHPLRAGYADLLENDEDQAGTPGSGFHASFCSDGWVIRNATEWTAEQIFETVLKAFLGGVVGAQMGDLTLTKPFQDAAEAGKGPSNIFSNRAALAVIFSFMHWDPLGSAGSQRYVLNMLPVLKAWLSGYSGSGGNEVGPVGFYDPTDDQRYILAWANDGDPETNEILFDFSITGANMVATTGGVAVDLNNPAYVEFPITVVPVQGAGLFTTIKLPTVANPLTSKWVLHLDSSYPTSLAINLPVLSSGALPAVTIALGNLTINLPVEG